MKKLSFIFLIFAGCASAPNPANFNSNFEFIGEGANRKACLPLEKVQKLREILILKCKQDGAN